MVSTLNLDLFAANWSHPAADEFPAHEDPLPRVFVGAHGWIFQEADAVGGVALRGRPRDELALEPLAAGDAAVGEAVGGGAGGAHGEVGHADVRGFDGDQIGVVSATWTRWAWRAARVRLSSSS